MSDWRNPDDYAYLKDYNLHEWAWEFLRRNRDYRRAFFAFEEAATRVNLVDAEGLKELWPFRIAASDPWNLMLPADPRRNFREGIVHFTQRAGVKLLKSWTSPELVPAEQERWPGYPVNLVLKFDLSYSVEILAEIAADQLRRCAEQIREQYPEYQPYKPEATRRFRKSNFPLYARILDADLSGAADGTITRELFADKADPRRSMTKSRETAHEMATQGYLDLLLRAPHDIGPLGGAKGPDD